jgi:MFS family permease
MAAGMLAFCYVQMRWAMVVFILLFSIGFGGGLTLRASILREYFGRTYFGKLIGIQFLSGSIGGTVGPILAGWAFDAFGTYRPIWFFMCGIIALAIGLTLMIKPLKA